MKREEKRLIELFRGLSAPHQKSLLEFAEFLATRDNGLIDQGQPEVLNLPRPKNETVPKAIRRLSATYPMLDKSKLLGEATAFMSQHLMEGRNAVEVIDELEQLFRDHYRQFLEE